MKATSTEEFKDIITIDFELQTYPNPDVQDKFIVSATNRDDIFAFVFEGPNIADACKQTGLFTGWKKNQKIKELEEELGRWKKEAADCLKLRDEAQEEAYKLKQDNEKLEEKIKSKNREINDMHMKLHQVEKDKERLTDRYKDLNDSFNELTKFYDKFKKEYEEKIRELKEENEKLKQLKTPTIENFVDEEPSSRRDILRCAEKCVCGQREQDYGTPESNFQLIADLWNHYLGITDYVLDMEQRFMDLNEKGIKVDIDFPKPKTIFPEDVAMMMALLKIARIRNGGGSGDSFVDLAGYAACGGEIWAGQRHQKDLN